MTLKLDKLLKLTRSHKKVIS